MDWMVVGLMVGRCLTFLRYNVDSFRNPARSSTTVWMVLNTMVDTGISTTNLNWFARFLKHHPSGVRLGPGYYEDEVPAALQRLRPDRMVPWVKNGCLLWVFPKIGVPPNHPILIGFSIINHPFWGISIFGNTLMVEVDMFFFPVDL